MRSQKATEEGQMMTSRSDVELWFNTVRDATIRLIFPPEAIGEEKASKQRKSGSASRTQLEQKVLACLRGFREGMTRDAIMAYLGETPNSLDQIFPDLISRGLILEKASDEGLRIFYSREQ